MRKPNNKNNPLKQTSIKLENLKSEKHLDSSTNMQTTLDCKTNLNGLNFGSSIKLENSNKQIKSTSSLFDGLYSNEDGDQEQQTSKRKHSSSTTSECNFSIEDDLIIDDDLLTEPKPMVTTKQKLSKFRRTEDSKPLEESLNDNLPNLTGLSEKVPKDTNENTVSISKRDLIVEKENSDDFNLHNML